MTKKKAPTLSREARQLTPIRIPMPLRYLINAVLVFALWFVLNSMIGAGTITNYWSGILITIGINIILAVSLNVATGYLGPVSYTHLDVYKRQALETPEAKLYKALDKLEAVIQHNESPISTWLPMEYELNLNYGADAAAFSPYLTELRAAMRRDTEEKIAAGK